MAKRFIDTELFERNWFLKLKPEERQAFIFIVCKCDCIGVYRYNMMHQMIFGKVEIEDLIKKVNGQMVKLDDDKYWLSDFCHFQYGTLTTDCRPHKKYVDELKKQGLLDRVLKGYDEPKQRVIEKNPKGNKKEKSEKKADGPTPQELRHMASELYSVYPRKVARPKGIEAIIKALSKVKFECLMEAVQEFANANEGRPASEKNLIPHASTWFNQERWTDDRDEWKLWRLKGEKKSWSDQHAESDLDRALRGDTDNNVIVDIP